MAHIFSMAAAAAAAAAAASRTGDHEKLNYYDVTDTQTHTDHQVKEREQKK